MKAPSGSTAGTALVAGLLASTVMGELKLPLAGIGLQNLVLPVCALGLCALHREDLAPTLRRQAWLLRSAVTLFLWSVVAALAGLEPALSLRLMLKSLTYALAFGAFLVVLAAPSRQAALHRTLLGFLVVLALGGLLEVAFPASLPFRWLRTERSLTILPRIASFQPWPNGFGVTMAAGVGLAGALRARGWIGSRLALACQLLMVVQVAQSGSRNAWGALGLTLAVLALSSARRGALACLLAFATAMLVLPVPAWQAGLRDHAPVIEALVPLEARHSTALADPLQSLSLRGKLWRAAGACVRRRPWLGFGPGVFSQRVAPHVIDRPGLNTHCLPLNLLVELGAPGLALSGLLLLAAWRAGRVVPWWSHTAVPALVALLSGQLVDCFLYDPTVVTLLALLVASLASPPPAAASEPG